MRINARNNTLFNIDNMQIENVENFTYLGSGITESGGTENDIRMRIGKVQQAFSMLNPVWRSGEYTTRTKIRIFQSNVMSVLLYGCETWKVTKSLTDKLQIFVNKCLRRIVRIFWPKTIRNEDLLHLTQQKRVENEIKSRKWGWIGHTLRKDNSSIAKTALEWNPQGKRKRCRPAQTWRRYIMDEIRSQGKSWNEVKALAQNRTRWRVFTEALCST
ncbi:uncharacterized protein LOC126889292 [Diabrotica virgifera virgifera]|uniref:DUF6451 domain-containing protein n=1 Tax=Diabrotica virgifera virgifera TaxID=50390 RepID=A0ABM5KT72_DIAVI|nr:uncharacterized protein LOC126889292 [Diabrotica virgifera virgifera]